MIVRLALGLALLVTACGKKETGAPASAPAAPAAVSRPVHVKPQPGAALGVAACDDYRTHFLKCIAKLPPDSAGPAKDDLEDTWAAWQSASTSPETAQALTTACAAARDAAKSAYAASGCEF